MSLHLGRSHPRFTASCTPLLRPCPPHRGCVRGVANQQDPSVAVGRGLPSHASVNREIQVGLWIP